MPKLLRIHNRLIIGGPTLNVLNLTKYLEPDFETLLIIGEKDAHEQDSLPLAKKMGITPLIIPEMGRAIDPLKDYNTYRQLRKVIKDFKPDIVHTHGAKPGAVGRLAAANARVPVVVHTYHGHVFHSYFNKRKTNVYINIERAMANRSSALIAISPGQKRELSLRYKIAKAKKFHVVPLGFDLSPFQTNQYEKRKAFRQEFNIADDEIAIGIISRLAPIKNHILFLEAISHVLQHTNKKIRAFIIGDGETKPHLQAKAAELGIIFSNNGDDVSPACTLRFTSWRTDVDVINAGLDIACLTSLNEGTPVSLIEAQAANKPVVTTKVGGINDIVLDGETGLLSDIEDKQQFFNNLLAVVNNDSLRNELGRTGSEWISEKYSVQRLAGDFRKLYYDLLAQKQV